MTDSQLERLLDQYREAVRQTRHAEHTGTYADGRVAAALKDENALRAQIRAHLATKESS